VGPEGRTAATGPERAILAERVSMRFRMPHERVDSLKEFLIRAVRRNLAYEDLLALDDVSFEVEKGDVFGIVGLNGSGKSTLLRVVSGILEPTSGRCRTIGSVSPLIELGAGFDMDLTARENVFLNGSLLGFSRKEMNERFDAIVEFSELGAFLDVALKNYSSGMIARLGFAVATVVDPDVLVLDEILAVGDFLFQEKCEKRIRAMMEGGTTVLVVSHSIDQVERMCRNALWLEHGRVRMQGPAQDVCEAYRNAR
jgi:ABC-2 type transport system ATP-binding protein